MTDSTQKQKDDVNFEQAFTRLEEILHILHTKNPNLEEALVLFEEANTLSQKCQQKLHDAEKKIDVLIKNRQGDLSFNLDGTKPDTQPFVHNK